MARGLIVLAALAAGCERPPAGGSGASPRATAVPTEAQVEQLDLGMTLAEVEGLLGEGAPATADDLANGVRPTDPTPLPAGAQVFRWGDSTRFLFLAFADGKIVRMASRGVPTPAEADLGLEEFATQLGFKRPKVLPKDPAGLKDLGADGLADLVKAGRVVVVWEAPIDSPVLAYTRRAAAKNGTVLVGGHGEQPRTRTLTRDELDRLLRQMGRPLGGPPAGGPVSGGDKAGR
jgi:hypothetical protein